MATKKTKKVTSKKGAKKSSRVSVAPKNKKGITPLRPIMSEQVMRQAQVRWATLITSEFALIIAGVILVLLAGTGGMLWYVNRTTYTSVSSHNTPANVADTHTGIEKKVASDLTQPPVKIYVGTDYKAILADLALRLKKSPDEITARITSYNGAYASGEYMVGSSATYGQDYQLDNVFYSVLYNEAWSTVYANYNQPTCSLLTQYHFPEDMTVGCVFEIQDSRWSADTAQTIIKTIDAKYAGVADYDETKVQLIQGNYVRGRIYFFEGYPHTFFVKRTADRWVVVSDTSEPVECDLLAGEGFPQTIYQSSCYREYELIRNNGQ